MGTSGEAVKECGAEQGTTGRPSPSPSSQGLATGLAYSAGLTVHRGALNPARALGPAFIANRWSLHWVYWVGPSLGAGCAALLHHHLQEGFSLEEKDTVCHLHGNNGFNGHDDVVFEEEAEVQCGEGGGRGGKDGGGGVENQKEVGDNLAEQEQVVSSQAAVFLAEEEVEEEGEGEEKGKKQSMVRGGRRERKERLRSLSKAHRLLIPYHTGERKFI